MLEVGQVYSDNNGSTIKITSINYDSVSYIINAYNQERLHIGNIHNINRALRFGGWELQSEQFKREYHCDLPPKCKHLNIREDRFFSAMVYKTCKDCGASLN